MPSQLMTKPSPILAHMPWHIKKSIIEYASTFSKISLRKCSRELREIVDKSHTRYSSITVTFHDEMVQLDIKALEYQPEKEEYRRREVSVEYHSQQSGCLRKTENGEKMMEGEDYIEMATKELASSMRSPKSEVRDLVFKSASGDLEENKTALMALIQTRINGLGHLLSVQSLRIEFSLSTDQLLGLLGLIQPGTLEGLSIRIADGDNGIERITGTEQWKRAQKLALNARNLPPLADLAHFREVTMANGMVNLEVMKDIIRNAVRNADNFEGIIIEKAKFADFASIDNFFYDHLEYEDDEMTAYRINVPDSKHSIVLELFIDKLVVRMESEEDN